MKVSLNVHERRLGTNIKTDNFDTFCWILCKYGNHGSSKNGACRGLDASEYFDITMKLTLGFIEEIAQIGTQLVFTIFQRAIFKI